MLSNRSAGMSHYSETLMGSTGTSLQTDLIVCRVDLYPAILTTFPKDEFDVCIVSGLWLSVFTYILTAGSRRVPGTLCSLMRVLSWSKPSLAIRSLRLEALAPATLFQCWLEASAPSTLY